MNNHEVVQQLEQLQIRPNEPTVEGDTVQEISEEEVNSKIWEEIDEKYELREETKAAMMFLRTSTHIDLGPIYKALTKCMISANFLLNY